MTASKKTVNEASIHVGKGAHHKGKGESQSAEAKAKAGSERSQASLKRQRQWQGRSDGEKLKIRNKAKVAYYSAMLRIIAASYVQTPADYFGSNLGLWRAPEVGEYFAAAREYKLLSMDRQEDRKRRRLCEEQWSDHTKK